MTAEKTPTPTAHIVLTPDRELQLAFARAVLEVEQQHGGQIFLDRAPHCNQWSARVFWPKWENPDLRGISCVESFHNILNYELELQGEYNDIEEQIELIKRTLIASIAKLRDNYGELLAEEARKLRKRAALAEEQLADMLAANGAH